VLTPKSMLRNRLAVSMPGDFTSGSWKPVAADPTISDPNAVTSVILCTGKVRWDLITRRNQEGKDGQVAIIPLERLYPLPTKQIASQLGRYDKVSEIRWVQDEPANQGAWPFMALNLPDALAEQVPGRSWQLVSITRAASSAPSVGSTKVHEAQQRALLDAAFA
jgi:2-oxoglutarate decarboxylase